MKEAAGLSPYRSLNLSGRSAFLLCKSARPQPTTETGVSSHGWKGRKGMDDAGIQVCTICGEAKLAGQVWFLIAGSGWEDKLKILQWHDKLAARDGIHHVCCPAHVQELVVHWMTTGSLDYPFAQVSPRQGWRVGSLSRVPIVRYELDTSCTRQVGELAVDRESIGRALSENPQSLQVILDELFDALEREAAGTVEEVGSKRETLWATMRHV